MDIKDIKTYKDFTEYISDIIEENKMLKDKVSKLESTISELKSNINNLSDEIRYYENRYNGCN